MPSFPYRSGNPQTNAAQDESSPHFYCLTLVWLCSGLPHLYIDEIPDPNHATASHTLTSTKSRSRTILRPPTPLQRRNLAAAPCNDLPRSPPQKLTIAEVESCIAFRFYSIFRVYHGKKAASGQLYTIFRIQSTDFHDHMLNKPEISYTMPNLPRPPTNKHEISRTGSPRRA